MRAVLVLTALSLLLAAPAQADHREFRLGVMDDQLDPRTDVAAMGRTGVSVYRTNFSWRRVEGARGKVGVCDPSIYDWTPYDSLVASASRRGVTLLPVIVASPDYVGPKHTQAPPTGSKAIVNYRCFVSALVDRYGRKGSYLRKNAAARPITDWQVWNEPNLKLFAARGEVNPREYARFTKVTSATILREDPLATIVLAGMPEVVNSGFPMRRFLAQFYKVSGIKSAFDAVAIHPYAQDHLGVEGALIRLRELLRRVGDKRRWVWVTEIGWASHGPKDGFLTKTEKGQARELRKTFEMLRANRRRLKVGTVTWFRWRDTRHVSGTVKGGTWNYAGLYRKDGTPKPACRAFARFTGGECRRIR